MSDYFNINIPTKLLMDLYDPQNAWIDSHMVTVRSVLKAVEENRLEDTPYEGPNWSNLKDRTEYHIERVAWLVVYPDEEPVCIDVGIPELACAPGGLLDGHHRLLAAFVADKETVAVAFQGSEGGIQEWLCGVGLEECDEED